MSAGYQATQDYIKWCRDDLRAIISNGLPLHDQDARIDLLAQSIERLIVAHLSAQSYLSQVSQPQP